MLDLAAQMISRVTNLLQSLCPAFCNMGFIPSISSVPFPVSGHARLFTHSVNMAAAIPALTASYQTASGEELPCKSYFILRYELSLPISEPITLVRGMGCTGLALSIAFHLLICNNIWMFLTAQALHHPLEALPLLMFINLHN